MIRDCLGELANVVAGQAKALLANTRYRFDIAIPEIVARSDASLRAEQGQDCFIVVFNGDVGEFALQLIFKEEKKKKT